MKDENCAYFDYNATTPIIEEVISAVSNSLKYLWANPSSSYSIGSEAKHSVEDSRSLVAELVNSDKEDGIVIFTSGGTESNALAIKSALSFFDTLNNDLPHVITSNIEHDSVGLLLKNLESSGSIILTIIPVSTKTGLVEKEALLSAITRNTILISIMLANNEIGIIQPLASLVEFVRSSFQEAFFSMNKYPFFHTDAAQAIGKISVNMRDLGVDYLAIAGHKFYAPRNGALICRKGECTKTFPLFPMFFGGKQEFGIRPGTENVAMINGLGAGAKFIIHNKNLFSHLRCMCSCLRSRMESAFKEIGVDISVNNAKFFSSSFLPNTLSIYIPLPVDLNAKNLLKNCKFLQASTGSACHKESSSLVLKAFGFDEVVCRQTVRLSVGYFTTKAHIDTAVSDIVSAYKALIVGKHA